jgi:hypothetical protein
LYDLLCRASLTKLEEDHEAGLALDQRPDLRALPRTENEVALLMLLVGDARAVVGF